jgi:CubicO group peptidase (beta-lactamase class C family)
MPCSGAVVAAATGCDYTDVVRQELLEPLGLFSTGFDAGVPAAGEWRRGIAGRGDR